MRRHKLAAPATRPQAAPAPLSDTPSPLHSARQTVPKRAIFLAGAKRTSLWAISKVPARRTGAAHHGAPSLHLTRAPWRTPAHRHIPQRPISIHSQKTKPPFCHTRCLIPNSAQPGATGRNISTLNFEKSNPSATLSHPIAPAQIKPNSPSSILGPARIFLTLPLVSVR
jgi:hypothetical protein